MPDTQPTLSIPIGPSKTNQMMLRMETIYRLLYSVIGVQWRSYNMMAQYNLLHYFMDRELVIGPLNKTQSSIFATFNATFNFE